MNTEQGTWQPLSLIERRVLGVLVEKQKTSKSADAYPLSLNALVTGCNQKSNRDPVLELEEDDVEDVLTKLQQKQLVVKIIGGRVERFRHDLYNVWKVDNVEMAILAELLLRGPQTEGELRGRASRMDDIADLDTLREKLRSLKQRHFVVYLTPEERRGTVVTHGFHPASELAQLRQRAITGLEAEDALPPTRPAPVPIVAAPVPSAELTALKAELSQATNTISELRRELTEVREQVQRLANQLRDVRAGLGLDT